MRSEEIRQRFLRHFEERGHTVVPSASLLADDPNLLLVNAGMVPFKPYFLGEMAPPYARAASVQKCVRTLDIDNVGRTTRHNSFFQMCGNFSFGDYFKAGAVPYAWELLTGSTESGGYGFDADRLWATVYHDDDEAFDLWTQFLPAERIQRRGMEDNYWSMGVPGPAGPCSEIYYDRGPDHGAEGGPIADETRYLEIWNLVFMQVERGEGSGKEFPILRDLPAKNIDTGMGLERVATLLQGVDNVYETDLLSGVLDLAQELTGTPYGVEAPADVSLRVIAEHARTVTMLIGDGVVPGNEGRGYVLRRMLRRVIRNVRLLGAEQPVMADLTAAVRDAMAPSYPELAADHGRIERVAVQEEETFLRTLRTGTNLLDTAVTETRASGATVLAGDTAFRLHDTFGFPIDLTLEMAAEQGLAVDEDAFRRLMREQQQAGKRDAQAKKSAHTDLSVYRGLLDAGGTVFTGFTEIVSEAVVRGLVLADGSATQEAGEGAEVEVVLDRTPFYAEGGGQLADQGRLSVGDSGELEVLDVQTPVPGVVIHRVKVLRGSIRTGAAVHAEVDVERRRAVSRAHTATHLVHRAFRQALGESATQAGSLNAPGRFRFDFASPGAVPPSVLADVEAEINAVLIDDLEVRAFVTTQDEARRIGAMALFGEKYGDEVRVVEVGDYARELCGGTHAARSGQLGLIKLLSEASIGAGVRRVEGLVGIDAFRHLAREHVLLAQVAEAVKAQPEDVPERVAGVLQRLREAEKELGRLRGQAVLARAGELAAGAKEVYGWSHVGIEAPEGTAAADVRALALDVRGRLDAGRPAVVVVAARGPESAAVVAAVNGAALAAGARAGELVRTAAEALGGKGGGRDDVAQGGGPLVDQVEHALTAAEHLTGRYATGGS